MVDAAICAPLRQPAGSAGPLRRASRLASAVLLATTLVGVAPVAVGTVGIAFADQPPLVDHCVGDDHPPFKRSYPPGGKSYLLIGYSAEAGVKLFIAVEMPSGPATQDVDVPASGTGLAVFPLQQFGVYPWRITIESDAGPPLASGSFQVGPTEVACDPATLAVASIVPSVAPSASAVPSIVPSATPSASASPAVSLTAGAGSASSASPSGTPPAEPAASGAAGPGGTSEESGGIPIFWLLLLLVGLLLSMAGGLILLFGIDFAGTTSCPDECPTLGAKQNCTLSAFGISSQGRTPDTDAGLDLALTLLRYAPLPGMGTGAFSIGRALATGSISPTPLPATASGAARGPTIDMTKALMGYLNSQFPQLWIKIDYDECVTARCFPQVWRTYRAWRRRTSEWTQVREATETVSNPMGVFPKVSDWTNVNIVRAINQAIVDTANSMGCQ